jgi:hypothetical protein
VQLLGRSAVVTTVDLKLLLSLTRLLWIIWMLLIAAIKVCSEVKSQVLHYQSLITKAQFHNPYIHNLKTNAPASKFIKQNWLQVKAHLLTHSKYCMKLQLLNVVQRLWTSAQFFCVKRTWRK